VNDHARGGRVLTPGAAPGVTRPRPFAGARILRAGGLLRQAPGLALGFAVFLQGCAGVIPGKEEARLPPAGIAGGEGSVLVRKGRPGIVIGAPYGALDKNTDVIAGDLARLTGFSLVVVERVAQAGSDGRGFDTNRVPATPARLAPETRRMDEGYWRHVADAAQGPLGLYVEVYGNGRGGNVGRVEITTVGLSGDDAWRLRTLFELIRDSRLDDPAVPRLEVSVESLDRLRSTASAARQGGVPTSAPRALHIDLPQAARTTYREVYTKVLGAFLSESVTFLVPRGR
jgi:hypothetical protein